MNATEAKTGNGKNDRRIVNNTARLVSCQGNSRKTYHIPPRGSIVVDEIEIRDLPMIKKLQSRGVIDVQDPQKAGKSRASAIKDSKSTSGTTETKTRKASPKTK